MRTRKWL